jgi:SAM-dependent methyltransferase
MTATLPPTATRRPLDAAALDALGSASAPDRPRLLSYVGRWGRARRWLPPDARRVLDVGCAFGYGTAALMGSGSSRRHVIGVEQDAAHLRAAARRFPWVPILRADATHLPIADGSVDAAVMLDVLEHVAEPSAVLAELRRVLGPGGVLIVSVPHRGLLTRFDSLNVYPAMRRRWPSWPALEPAEHSASGEHRHFSVRELESLLGPRFRIERVARSGLGSAELFHLAILLIFKALLGWRSVYRALMGVHLLLYIVDDAIPAGRLGYYVTILARAQPEAAL